MKRVQVIVLLFLPVFLFILSSGAAAEESGVGFGLDEATAGLQQAMDAGAEQPDAFSFRFGDVAADLAQGKWTWNWADMANRLLRLLFEEWRGYLSSFIQMVAVAVLAGMLYSLQASFAGKELGNIGFFACYAIIAGLSIPLVRDALSLATYAIDRMVLFMQALIPPLITSLAAGGSTAGAAAFSPTLLGVTQLVMLLSKHFFLPLITILAALSAINHMSERFHLTKLAGVCRQTVKWTLGLLMTVFLAVLSMQGLTTSMLDGVAGRTVKYAVGNFIPMVGGVLAESVEAVASSASVVRGAVGVAGMFAVVGMCVGPLIKLLAAVAAYKLAAAVAEPVSDKRVTALLGDLADTVTLLFVIVLVVCVMFIIGVAIMCAAGNAAAAVRT